MDKFGRYYAWFLLLVTALPALMRLLQTRQVAELVSVRLQDDQKRARSRKIGMVSAAASLVLIPVYFLYSRQAWIAMAFVVGVLTGVEMVGNAARPDPASLTRQNRIFGALYAIVAVAIAAWIVHR